MASERIPALETMIAGLRQSLSETQAALSDSQEHAARLAARLPECDRIIDEMRAQAATDAAQLARLQAEMEALWDHLAAARADARAAREAALAAVAPLQAASRTDDDETPDPAAARRSPIWMRRPSHSGASDAPPPSARKHPSRRRPTESDDDGDALRNPAGNATIFPEVDRAMRMGPQPGWDAAVRAGTVVENPICART